MFSYFLRRLLLMIPTLLGVTAVVFLVMAWAPGGIGNVKRSEGGGMQSREGQRQIERMKRRYALDRPVYVQYARWLNQVSPVGFCMSDKVEWSEQELNEARTLFAAQPLAQDASAVEQAVRGATVVAGYEDKTPKQVAEAMIAVLNEPAGDRAFALFEPMHIKPLAPEEIKKQIEQLQARNGLGSSQAHFIGFFAGEVQGQARVLFSKPKFKLPDLGSSLRGRKVVDMILETLPTTLLLNVIALPIIYWVSIVSGVFAARHKGGLFDVGSGATFMALWSMPVMVSGMLCIVFLASAQFPQFHFFPANGLHDISAASMPFFPRWNSGVFERGYLLDFGWHCILPILCLSYTGFATMSRVQRGAVLDVLSSDYIRTARAKGVSEKTLLWKHTFRNATLPLITMLSGVIPGLLGGAFVVETIFGINGMGRLGVESASSKDFEVVLATTLVGSILVMLCDIGRDFAYALADPRVSYE